MCEIKLHLDSYKQYYSIRIVVDISSLKKMNTMLFFNYFVKIQILIKLRDIQQIDLIIM